jgi:hypothetical protein
MAGKRTTIAPKGDKRYIRRDAKGRITESDDVGRSLAAAESLKGKTFENFDDDTTVINTIADLVVDA